MPHFIPFKEMRVAATLATVNNAAVTVGAQFHREDSCLIFTKLILITTFNHHNNPREVD